MNCKIAPLGVFLFLGITPRNSHYYVYNVCMTNTTIHEGNNLALKYFDQLRAEVIEHDETKKHSQRRLDQIRHLLLENHKLHVELEQERARIAEFIHSPRSKVLLNLI